MAPTDGGGGVRLYKRGRSLGRGQGAAGGGRGRGDQEEAGGGGDKQPQGGGLLPFEDSEDEDMRDRQHYVVRVSPTNAETEKSQLYIQVPCYRSLYLLRMHTELTLPGEEDIYFGLDKHKHKRGELLVVEEGKGGSFTCVGGRQGVFADYKGRWISRVRGMFEGASPWDVLRKGNGEVPRECSAVNPLTEACFVHVS